MERLLAILSDIRPRRAARSSALVVSAFVVWLAAIPSAGWAASVQVENGIVQFTAARGEANRVFGRPGPEDVLGQLDLRDDGAPLTAGAGCEDLGVWVRCYGGPDAYVRVLDGADQVHLEHYGLGTTIWGGEGNDDIYGGSGAGSTTIHGEAGSDTLFTSNNGSDAVITGGSGADSLTIGEATGGYYSGGSGNDRIRYNPLGEGGAFPAAAAMSAMTWAIQPVIDGGSGDDVIEAGLLPADRIDGGPGTDTLTYFGGGTIDAAVSRLETVISLGGHTILGTKRGDRLISIGGDDSIFALGGDDFIDVRNDTSGDSVDCGPGRDEVHADTGDSVASNCEVLE